VSDAIDTIKRRLDGHRIYSIIQNVESLRFFMERHIICVWDFMSLLKSLQGDIVGTRVPWIPPEDAYAARLINEIVLDEESDEMPGGGYGSHFELYLRAMDELGCDLSAITGFLASLKQGVDPQRAINESKLALEAKEFTRTTTAFLDAPLHVRAAVFLHGREELLPDMFVNFVRSLRRHDVPCERFLDYLERHIDTDGERHGPMARRLMERLIGDHPDKRHAAQMAATQALQARMALWDAVAGQIEAEFATPTPDVAGSRPLHC
jgi:hypothetical protein